MGRHLPITMKLGGGSGWPLRRAQRDGHRVALLAAKVRLDRLRLYPRPVSLVAVRIHVWPWFFRLPALRRFDGFAGFFGQIILREEVGVTDLDLVCHELCHVWQMQHHPARMPLSYLRTGYGKNPYEAEARSAVSRTRGTV